MNFDLDEQQEMMRDLVARFLADTGGIEARAIGRRQPEGFARANWRSLAELGLLALPFEEASGGIGGGIVDVITIAEELGRGLAAEPWLSDLVMAGRLLERAGSPAQVEAWIGPVIAGDRRIALAHAEHDARYHPTHVSCEARGGVIEGAKTFVLAGAGADAFIVSAREGGAVTDPGGIGLYLVAADAPGLVRRDYRLTDGSVASELRLHRVAGERLPGEAAPALAETMDETRLAAAAEMIGVMDMLLTATLDHLRTRNQFGQPIGSFQAIQHRMAQAYVRLEQSRSQLLRAALSDRGADRAARVAGAKAFVSENAVRLGEECIQMHGGMGVSDELAIGHGHKRIMLLANLLGDPDSELARYVRLVA